MSSSNGNSRGQNQRVRRGERGAVLITVMLVMLALLGLGVTALWITSSNLQVGANANMRNQALYVAEAGIERVRADLNGGIARDMPVLLQGSGDVLDNRPTGVDGNGRPTGIGVIYFWDASIPAPRPGPLAAVDFPPASFNRGAGATPTSTTMGRYTVWIRNDTAELRQSPTMITADTNGTVVVRSRGVASDDRTEVVLEVTMGRGLGANSPTFCNAGKNACDENSSTLTGIYAQ